MRVPATMDEVVEYVKKAAHLAEVAAESLKLGQHEGECVFNAMNNYACSQHIEASEARAKALRAAISDLDPTIELHQETR